MAYPLLHTTAEVSLRLVGAHHVGTEGESCSAPYASLAAVGEAGRSANFTRPFAKDCTAQCAPFEGVLCRLDELIRLCHNLAQVCARCHLALSSPSLFLRSLCSQPLTLTAAHWNVNFIAILGRDEC